VKIALAILMTAATMNVVVHGQTGPSATPIPIDDLRTPTSPAFVLLDVTPAAVERPENPRALVLNLLQTASQSDGLPKNYALQVTPYWLKSHPDLTFTHYQNPSPAASMLRTTTFSVAMSPLLDPLSDDASTVGTRIGLGARTNIVGGQPSPLLPEKLDELQAINKRILDDPDNADLRDDARSVALEIQKLERVGLFVSAAAALVWSVPQDEVARSRRDRWGVWVTPAYRFLACRGEAPCKSVIDAIAVVRAIRARDDDTQWDLGARLLWQPTEPFTISSEWIRRRGQRGDDRSSDRTVAILEYRIREDMLLFGSFGRDFGDDESRRTLVSIMGLSFGFGAKPMAR
jgi:hypothetical protein